MQGARGSLYFPTIPEIKHMADEAKAKIGRLGEAWADIPILSGKGDNEPDTLFS